VLVSDLYSAKVSERIRVQC